MQSIFHTFDILYTANNVIYANSLIVITRLSLYGNTGKSVTRSFKPKDSRP